MRDGGSGSWDAGSKNIREKIQQHLRRNQSAERPPKRNVLPLEDAGNRSSRPAGDTKTQLYIVNSASSFLYAMLNDLKIFGGMDFTITRVDNLDTLKPEGMRDVIVVDGSVDTDMALWELHRACALAPEVPVIFLHESGRRDIGDNAATCGAADSIHMKDLTVTRLEDAIEAALGQVSGQKRGVSNGAPVPADDGDYDLYEPDMHTVYYSWLRNTLNELDMVHANAVLARTSGKAGEDAGSPVVQERMDYVIRSTDRIRRGIQEMIWVFQAASQTPEAAFTRMDVRLVVDDAIAVALQRTGAEAGAIEFLRPAMPVMVDVDPNQLFDGLTELFERSLAARGDSETVSLRLAVGQGCFEIGVEMATQPDLSGTVMYSVAEGHGGNLDVFEGGEGWYIFLVAPLRHDDLPEDDA